MLESFFFACLLEATVSYSGKGREDLARPVKACIELNLPEENKQVGTSKLHCLGIETHVEMDSEHYTSNLSTSPSLDYMMCIIISYTPELITIERSSMPTKVLLITVYSMAM